MLTDKELEEIRERNTHECDGCLGTGEIETTDDQLIKCHLCDGDGRVCQSDVNALLAHIAELQAERGQRTTKLFTLDEDEDITLGMAWDGGQEEQETGVATLYQDIKHGLWGYTRGESDGSGLHETIVFGFPSREAAEEHANREAWEEFSENSIGDGE